MSKPTKRDQLCNDIREKMKTAGIYEERYEFQIASLVDITTEIEEMKRIIKKEGRMITEIKTAGVGTKQVAHPLLMVVCQYERTKIQILASLGLNKMAEKKTEAPKNEDINNHPWTRFNEAIQ